ncbi:UvrD-helicase domain-containing protein [Flavobacteriaceae bacterium XHP0103]|uniref:UvrD-helicase domain-containing protein n=1 Tax=Marixanthotalea marina TaxID=2844359 RepID=UPI002989FABB|nr:UvrD-helicase domain-containing protein [Marixanthotalea marina]MBU3820552.1 UvrD-helicase domain-containing protein [Marixanthotalea marina]
MQELNTFTIYNASAGSGKTFVLVKEYLKVLFKSNNPNQFKHILAITFTNKAVAEMKERIIETLKQFSDASILDSHNSMFKLISEELDIEPKTLHYKSKKVLNTIVHNYAAFNISTIDGFTHNLIRTFAHDLKLPLNFEVELDQEALINEAVDSLIAKAGTDIELTKVLVDFAIEKADDDKSWDVSYDFNKIAKLLVNENDLPFINALKDKTLGDFKVLKTHLKKTIKTTETTIVENAKCVLTLINEAGLEHSNFSRSTLPNHFKKASELLLNGLYENNLENNIRERNGIYTKTLKPDIANIIDSILPQIEIYYETIKTAVFHYKFLKNFYKNITPLSVLNAINNELAVLKEEQHKMLISEFNSIISSEIKNQPTPFIYERIGEKFNHYFIDEFQDTSQLQWENLIPLIDNSLSTEKGTAMLVGDAKQSIYRWRGGKAEQFIDLFNKKSQPFVVEQKMENLEFNYRSHKEIVDFNNSFFSYLSGTVFNNKDHQNLYANAYQEPKTESEGYVNITFLEINKEDDKNELYSQKVLETIQNCLDNGFELCDICVLVRKKKEGIVIADYLSQNNINIVSSETLLIKNASEVTFVNNILTLLAQPKNNDIKIKVLTYLTHLLGINNKHEFFSKHIDLPLSQLFKSLETYGVFINAAVLLQSPLYDTVEAIVRAFNLAKTPSAYIQFYLDFVLEYSQKNGADLHGFLAYYEKKKETLSIVSAKDENAVQIMTIHKSKGLEFPVVIFPFADLDIYAEREPKAWYSLNPEEYHGFTHTLLNYNSDFEHYSEDGTQIYNYHQAELELDNINLLYVALTRPVNALYIISAKDLSSKGKASDKKYSGLLVNYLKHLNLWDDTTSYSFGNQKRQLDYDKPNAKTIVCNSFISTAKEDHNIKIITKSGYLWDSTQEEAIEKGNLIHDIMSRIQTKNDIDFVIDEFINESVINRTQATELKSKVQDIVIHPELAEYFSDGLKIYNEIDIINAHGIVLRPDKVVVNSKNEAVIIDYKSGKESNKHLEQLHTYQAVLEEMGKKVIKKILVYTNNTILVRIL